MDSDTPTLIEGPRVDDLAPGQPHLLKADGRRIVLVRTDDGIYAVDDQCPHEGYPLSKGTVTGCVLTCPWHNFKFDVTSGACVKGDEAVRAYPVRVTGGRVVVEVVDPHPIDAEDDRFASLDKALGEQRMGQAARDVVRLIKLGIPPERIAAFVARWDARYAEYGTSHALPVACDVLPMLRRYPGVQAVHPLTLPMDLASTAHVRRPERVPPTRTWWNEDEASLIAQLRVFIEAEEADNAEALARGALAAAPDPRATLRAVLYPGNVDHFLDFGHQLIYTVKLEDLLDRVGWDTWLVGDLAGSLVFSMVSGTREDTLPEWRWLDRRLADLEGEWAALRGGQGPAPDGLAAAVLDGRREAAFDALLVALRGGADPVRVAEVLVGAAAERLLRFDVSIDGSDEVQDDWLDVTHTLTYASAVRHALQRWPEPRALRLLFFATRFVNNAQALDLDVDERLTVTPRPAHVEEVVAAIAARDVQAAVDGAAGLVASGEASALRAGLEDLAISDRFTRPIVAGHLLKTLAVAFDEAEVLGDPLPVLAVVRMAASPIRERRVTRLAHEAIRLVEHGQVPKTLT